MGLTNKKDLIQKIKRGIGKTGFPLEMEIGDILRSREWFVVHSHYYVDPEEFIFRECDIRACKIIEGIQCHLFIACKHSTDTQWVFFVPTQYSYTFSGLKYLPIRVEFELPLPTTKVFDLLPVRSPSTSTALNMSIFKGDEPQTKQYDFRSALFSVTKALLAMASQSLTTKARNIYLPVIVFDGPIFIVRKEKGTRVEESSHVVYKHFAPLNLWGLSARQLGSPFYKDILGAKEILGDYYLIEILAVNHVEAWLKKLEDAISVIGKSDLSRWGVPAVFPPKFVSAKQNEK